MSTLQKKWIVTAFLAVSLMLALAACGPGQILAAAEAEPTPLPVITKNGVANAEGRIVPMRSAILSFQNGGEIGEIPVNEGDQVAQGDVLVRLSKGEALEAALAQARLEQLAAQQALDDLNDTSSLSRNELGKELMEARQALNEAQKAFNDVDTDTFRTDLDARRIDVEEAQDKLDDAQEELDKYKDLDPDNTTRKNAQTTYDNAKNDYDDAVYERDTLQNEVDQAQANLDMAASHLDDLQRKYDDRSNGPDPDELALAQARVENADAQVAAARRTLDNMQLTAPYASTVVDLHDLEPGENVTPGLPVVTLADYSAWMVETRDLTELDVVSIEVGQAVEVVPDALPDLTLTGKVESVARAFTERSGDILYKVRIRLDEGDPRLRWGMTVTITFEP